MPILRERNPDIAPFLQTLVTLASTFLPTAGINVGAQSNHVRRAPPPLSPNDWEKTRGRQVLASV